jgi:K+-sensing histidine kinase KdpD
VGGGFGGLAAARALRNAPVRVTLIDRCIDDPEKIFDAFVTTKEKGMGGGLAVSRSIAEAHQGELWAENSLNFGATFTLKIPRCKSASPAEVVAARVSPK